MPLTSGTRLGPYEVLTPLGAGGMGEVYRATDTRLKRQVAIKILPAALAADPDRLARFQREAEILASLNNAHIAAIYGLEDAPASAPGQTGMKALVMELVEGPTLAERIAEGQIPIDEATPIAVQVARALEAAHDRGIIHRDLKPANIKVRDDGPVKVLDFGLAKLTDSGASGIGRGDPSQSPTMAEMTAMTGIGTILGTAAYMSPEQARGRAVDKRTDVWAFGAVLYEMLTGTRAFEGDDIAETIAAVLKSTPDWSALPADVPPNVVTLIQRCLDKDRNTRIGDMAVARFLLEGSHATTSSVTAPAPATAARIASPAPESGWRRIVPWTLAALLAGTLVGWLLPHKSASAPLVTHLQMSVVPAENLVWAFPLVRPSRTSIAISPDGRTVVFAGTRNKVTQLYTRGLDRAEASAIAGTEDAVAPFFSPDGAWIGFWTADKIKKVPAGGGAVATICDLPAGNVSSASWADDGTIFFANRATVSKVSSAGGTPTAMVTADSSKSERLLLVQALPGAKAILFTSVLSFDWATATLVVQSVDAGDRRVLLPGVSDARYVNSGHLLYMKGGTLIGVPFDAQSRHITGAPVALVEGVMHALMAPNANDDTGAGQFAVSASGTLIYASGGVAPLRKQSFVWVDRKGTVQPLTAVAAGAYLFPRLSPDGQKFAASLRDEGHGPDIWVFDVARGAPTRLTFNGGNNPVWSPDGKRIVFSQGVNGVNNLHVIDAAGGGQPERLLTSTDAGQTPTLWSRATNTVAFLQRTKSGANAIWVLPMDGDRRPRVFVESAFALWHPEFSPDGRFLAYISNESGTYEVYVQPYPGPGEKVRVSTARGSEPIWTADGRELLYRSGTQERDQVLSAAIRSTSPFRVDLPRVLFDVPQGQYDSTAPGRAWDISADGQRFLLQQVVPPTDEPVTALHVVLNWTEELKRQAQRGAVSR
jgi:Tol biopolymer transport system component